MNASSPTLLASIPPFFTPPENPPKPCRLDEREHYAREFGDSGTHDRDGDVDAAETDEVEPTEPCINRRASAFQVLVSVAVQHICNDEVYINQEVDCDWLMSVCNVRLRIQSLG